MDSHRPDRCLARRSILRAGAATWLGLILEDLSRGRAVAGSAAPGRRPVRGVILAFCTGGISQLDTFDPKPDAPAEVRGGFATIATAMPGVRVCEHVPGLARRLDRATLVRSMTTPTLVHEPAAHRIFGGGGETRAGRGPWATGSARPPLGSLVAAVAPRGAPGGLPPAVVLPPRLDFEGAIFPGQ